MQPARSSFDEHRVVAVVVVAATLTSASLLVVQGTCLSDEAAPKHDQSCETH